MGCVEKIWGTTESLIATSLFEMHRLTIEPSFRCSLHLHRHKWNAFYVVSGRLFIDTIDGDIGSLVISTKLEPGDHTTISPGLHHQFRTEDLPCIALEMYYCEPLSEDIVRRNVGGPV